jgi:hypothetical protein
MYLHVLLFARTCIFRIVLKSRLHDLIVFMRSTYLPYACLTSLVPLHVRARSRARYVADQITGLVTRDSVL